MKKKDFVTLVMAAVGGILFALGMCMVLLPEWNALPQGVVLGAAGLAVLLAMVLVRRRMAGRPAVVFSRRTAGVTLLGIAGGLVFGVGMCMVMIRQMMLWGIVVGIAGILLLLCLIPAVRGFKE